MLSFSTVDNQHRQSFVATSLDEGFCVIGDGNEARRGAPVWCGTNSWSAAFRTKLNTALATLTITTHTKAVPKFTEKLKDLRPLLSNFYKVCDSGL